MSKRAFIQQQMKAKLLSLSLEELQNEFGEGWTDIEGNPVDFNIEEKDDHVVQLLIHFRVEDLVEDLTDEQMYDYLSKVPY